MKKKNIFYPSDCGKLNFILKTIPIDATVLYIIDNKKDGIFANVMSVNGHNVETVHVDCRIGNDTDYSFNPHDSLVNLSRLNNKMNLYYIKEKETFSVKNGIPYIDGFCYNLSDDCQYVNSNHYDYIIYHGSIFQGIDKDDSLGLNGRFTKIKKIKYEGSK